jgi:hypothetical protein
LGDPEGVCVHNPTTQHKRVGTLAPRVAGRRSATEPRLPRRIRVDVPIRRGPAQLLVVVGPRPSACGHQRWLAAILRDQNQIRERTQAKPSNFFTSLYGYFYLLDRVTSTPINHTPTPFSSHYHFYENLPRQLISYLRAFHHRGRV